MVSKNIGKLAPKVKGQKYRTRLHLTGKVTKILRNGSMKVIFANKVKRTPSRSQLKWVRHFGISHEIGKDGNGNMTQFESELIDQFNYNESPK